MLKIINVLKFSSLWPFLWTPGYKDHNNVDNYSENADNGDD